MQHLFSITVKYDIVFSPSNPPICLARCFKYILVRTVFDFERASVVVQSTGYSEFVFKITYF